MQGIAVAQFRSFLHNW